MQSRFKRRALPGLVAILAVWPANAWAQDAGESIPAAAISPLREVTMAELAERELSAVRSDVVRGVWHGEDGQWFVPSMTARTPVRSGRVAIVNQWGDPNLGIGFRRSVDVMSIWLGGQGVAPASSVVVLGYRNGIEVARSDRFELEAGRMRELEPGLEDVDRIVLLAEPTHGARGYLALDDLRFRPHGSTDQPSTLDFEDLDVRTVLTGSAYGGLRWETGTGLRGADRDRVRVVHAPESPVAKPRRQPSLDDPPDTPLGTVSETAPSVMESFIGPRLGDPGGGWIPPDSCGAVGTGHFLSVVNANLSVWDRGSGARLFNIGLDTFFGTSMVGDPRAIWDPHGRRYVVIATDFSTSRSIYVGVSRGDDPTGTWDTFSFRTDRGADAGRWPDYPTIGVDARGLYLSAYMVGGSPRMTIWAMPTGPLYQTNPTTPPIVAWRSLPWDGAIQPCITYGDPGLQYFVSRRSSTLLRLRSISWSGSVPALSNRGSVAVAPQDSPPDAPALGSSIPISTLDARLMNAVFRNGSVWTVQGLDAAGRAALRWYEIAVAPLALVQAGTIEDPLWCYYFGSIAVDSRGDVGIGFSGSHGQSHVSTFVSGRLQDDPHGAMAAPTLVKAGEGAYTMVDNNGRNRWGDYSMTTVDPVDDRGFWTIQEYASSGNQWANWITRFGYEAFAYGDGLPGTSGEPMLRVTSRPRLGATMPVAIGNSSGQVGAAAVLVLGVAPASSPLLGGTLLVQPAIVANLALSTTTSTVPIAIPNDPALPGVSLFLQSIQVDAGAVFGLSFTRGLEIRPVTR